MAQFYEGIGRRKSASARVRVAAGSGKFEVNGKNVEDYFTRPGDVATLSLALGASSNSASQYDITVIVNGGGVTGQTDAVKLGLSRALMKMNGEYQPIFRKAGLLTRDPREKERKKPGLKKARKAPTYTKR